MSKVASALRTLCAITLASAITPAFADRKEPPESSWEYYLANCKRMQEKIADVQSGRIPSAYEVIGDLENSLRSINQRRSNLTPQYLAPANSLNAKTSPPRPRQPLLKAMPNSPPE